MENAVPVNGDQLVFSAATRYTITNNISNLWLDRIAFSDGGYLVHGNGVTVTNGIVSAPAAPATGHPLEIDLTLGAAQTFRCDRTNLSFAGAISLGANTLTVTNPASTEAIIGAWAGTGLISGMGGITKHGAGTLNFAGGSVANTYSGPAYVKNGTLLLGWTSVPYIPGLGTLTIGDGSGSTCSAVVRYAGNDQIGSAPMAVNTDGLLDLAGYSETVGSITMQGGNISTGLGLLTLGSNVTNSVASTRSSISGNLAHGSSTRYFHVELGGGSPYDVEIGAVVSVNFGIVKTGTGKLMLAGANTLTGTVEINQGYLDIGHASALGTTDNGTIVNGHLEISGSGPIHVDAESLTINNGSVRVWGPFQTHGRDA